MSGKEKTTGKLKLRGFGGENNVKGSCTAFWSAVAFAFGCLLIFIFPTSFLHRLLLFLCTPRSFFPRGADPVLRLLLLSLLVAGENVGVSMASLFFRSMLTLATLPGFKVSDYSKLSAEGTIT
ncbi:unnamed protein product [Lactuca saligna]|uniref:Uncharacterized protein n=1 Tax=Lactuca saligna TaxID=75948 RepID=A0AA35ZEX4_LACSI|nr:unnamed protein product [Lactuca saligna]